MATAFPHKTLVLRWTVALLYVGFIYGTLSVVRGPVEYLRSHNVLRLSLAVLYAGCVGALFARLLSTGTRDPWRYAAFAAASTLYYLLGTSLKIPEERIHFFEYGLVGVLFARALWCRFGASWPTVLIAFALSSVAGVLDELLQGLTPSRHFDVRDIYLNVVSAALGLVVYAILPHQNPRGDSWEKS